MVAPVLSHWLCVEVYVITIDSTICTCTFPGHRPTGTGRIQFEVLPNSHPKKQ